MSPILKPATFHLPREKESITLAEGEISSYLYRASVRDMESIYLVADIKKILLLIHYYLVRVHNKPIWKAPNLSQDCFSSFSNFIISHTNFFCTNCADHFIGNSLKIKGKKNL